MIRIAILIASIAMLASSIPASASECSSVTEIAATRAGGGEPRRYPEQAHATCRDYAASFYRIVLTRRAAVACGVGRKSDLAALDSEIDALNDLLATRCGG